MHRLWLNAGVIATTINKENEKKLNNYVAGGPNFFNTIIITIIIAIVNIIIANFFLSTPKNKGTDYNEKGEKYNDSESG